MYHRGYSQSALQGRTHRAVGYDVAGNTLGCCSLRSGSNLAQYHTNAGHAAASALGLAEGTIPSHCQCTPVSFVLLRCTNPGAPCAPLVLFQVALDIVLPVCALLLLYKVSALWHVHCAAMSMSACVLLRAAAVNIMQGTQRHVWCSCTSESSVQDRLQVTRMWICCPALQAIPEQCC